MGRKKGKKNGVVRSGIVDHGNFDANWATAGIKFTTYEKEQRAVQLEMKLAPTRQPCT
jgi:hypothetical protein